YVKMAVVEKKRISKRTSIISGVVLGVVLLLVVAYFGIGAFVYNKLSVTSAHCGTNTDDAQNTPSHFTYTDHDDLDPAAYQMPTYEDVSFPSRNSPSITIVGWFVPAEVD